MKSHVLKSMVLTGGNILGPLAIFGGIGYALTKAYNSSVYVLIGIGIAFVITNILIFTTAKYILNVNKK